MRKINLLRNLASAQASLWFEHDAIRKEYAQIIAHGDRKLARRLYRAKQNDAHFTECIDLERKLKKADRRYAFRLTRYGVRVGEIIDEIDRLLKKGVRRN